MVRVLSILHCFLIAASSIPAAKARTEEPAGVEVRRLVALGALDTPKAKAFIRHIEEVARTLPSERAAARRSGIPLTAADMRSPELPTAEDAAPDYVRLTRLLKAKPLAKPDEDLVVRAYQETLTGAEAEHLRNVLQQQGNVLAQARRAAAKGGCNFHRNWALGFNLQFPEFAIMRRLIRLISAESCLMARDGHPQEALRNQELAFRIARHAGSDGFIISYLVEVAGHAISGRGVETILRLVPPEANLARQAGAILLRHPAPADLSPAVKREVGLHMAVLQQLRRGDVRTFTGLIDEHPAKKMAPLTPAERRVYQRLIDGWEADVLGFVRDIIAALQLPLGQRSARLAALQNYAPPSEDAIHFWRVAFAPAADLDKARTHVIARERVTRMACRVLEIRADSGKFPEVLPNAPELSDPFTGKPLGYRREGAGLVIYSTGKDGRFNGGSPETPKAEQKKQAFFRYPGR
jgi:hypothetical protein